MISKWRLYNFKSVGNETELDLGPLTVFSGSNSSGKSTVLQSMLMVAQTLASRVPSRSVVLNGMLVKLGQFDDLKSFDSVGNQILVGWECRPKQMSERSRRESSIIGRSRQRYGLPFNLNSVICELSFDASGPEIESDMLQLHPDLFGYRMEARFDSSRVESADISILRSTTSTANKLHNVTTAEGMLAGGTGLEYDVTFTGTFERPRVFPSDISIGTPIGCLTRHFMPFEILTRYDIREALAYSLADTLMTGFPRFQHLRRFHRDDIKIPSTVVDYLNNEVSGDLDLKTLGQDSEIGLRQLLQKLRNIPRLSQTESREERREEFSALYTSLRTILLDSMPEEYGLDIAPLPDSIRAAADYTEDFFSNHMRYLGPLRDEPKPLYPLAPNTDPVDIGLKGEHTASVLDIHRDKRVRYIPTSEFERSTVRFRPANRKLETAVLDWLRYMGIADKLDTRDRGKLGHELQITTPGTNKMHDLTHVGVGVSQVLPILVMCLLAEADSTVIIEQPELHLHPRVQTLLGDFFLSMAFLDRQIIVETHSEYIINRLRFRAASAESDLVANQLKIYFAEKQKGTSHFREVNVNQYGAIIDWPEGFFDQSQSEAEDILRVAVRKRRAERSRRDHAQRDD